MASKVAKLTQRRNKLGKLLQKRRMKSLKPTFPLQTTRKADKKWGVEGRIC